MSELELWKSNAAGRVVVRKMGQYGVETEEMVEGFRTLHISEADRKLNQERAASDDLDVFKNGMLSPIRLGDSAAEFADNPNHLTESDMRELVKAHPKTFAKRISEITNPVLIGRLLEVAREEDCTMSRLELLQARMEDVDPVKTVKIQSHAPDERQSSTIPVTVT